VRKVLIAAGLALLVTVSAGAGAAWATDSVRKQIEVEYRGMSIAVDGQKIEVGDLEPFIYLEKGRTFVPARPLAEALGAKVDWDAESSTVLVFTKAYVGVSQEGETNVWSSPALGFTLKAPASFARQPAATAALQLARPDPATGTNSVVAFSADVPMALPSRQIAEATITAMAQVGGVTGAKAARWVEAEERVTAYGTGALVGRIPVVFAVRVIKTESATWMLTYMTAQSNAATLEPVLQQIMDSFALQ